MLFQEPSPTVNDHGKKNPSKHSLSATVSNIKERIQSCTCIKETKTIYENTK